MQAELARRLQEPLAFFNDGLLRITGYSREEMLGLNS
jgi:PAS domain-containing protein